MVRIIWWQWGLWNHDYANDDSSRRFSSSALELVALAPSSSSTRCLRGWSRSSTLATYDHLREDINRKKTFSFGHCPNHLNPPPSPDPNSGNLVLFLGRQKRRFARMTKRKRFFSIDVFPYEFLQTTGAHPLQLISGLLHNCLWWPIIRTIWRENLQKSLVLLQDRLDNCFKYENI